MPKKPKTPATKTKAKAKPEKEPDPVKVEQKEEVVKTVKEEDQKIEPNILKEKEPPAKEPAGTEYHISHVLGMSASHISCVMFLPCWVTFKVSRHLFNTCKMISVMVLSV